jgi:LPXTG-site transpeptidase (sortase) family protein
MRIKQRYLFVIAIGVVLLAIGIGVWTWHGILSLPNPLAQHLPHPIEDQPPSSPSLTPMPSPQPAAGGLDVSSGARLLIPAIGVNAPIETVARDAEGHMGVPIKNRWEGVGWYQYGPEPGQRGSAVIDGHLDRIGGAPAVFWNLDKLHVGDVVSVQDKSKRVLHFQVMKVTSYSIYNAPLVQIFGKNDGAYLNLITCSGSWSTAANQYSQRLVVFTRLIS